MSEKAQNDSTKQWETEEALAFAQIGIKIGEAAVHVENDAALKKYMGLHFNKAMELSKYIRKCTENSVVFL